MSIGSVAGQSSQQVACFEFQKYANFARRDQAHGVVQRRRFGDVNRLVVQRQTGGALESQSAATGTGADNDRLSRNQFTGDGSTKWFGAISGSHDVDEVRVL